MDDIKPCPVCGREARAADCDQVYCTYCDCSLLIDECKGSRSIPLWNSLERPTTPPTVSTRIQVASQTLSLTQDEAQTLWDALTPHVRHPDLTETKHGLIFGDIP